MTTTATNSDNIIDLRDVIARVEELRTERDEYINPEGDLEAHDTNLENLTELASLEALLDECKGNGGDEQWEGAWYPVTLVRDSYFETYAQELADDIGAVDKAATWPANCIDWELAARELQQDYTGIEFDGVTYWVR